MDDIKPFTAGTGDLHWGYHHQVIRSFTRLKLSGESFTGVFLVFFTVQSAHKEQHLKDTLKKRECQLFENTQYEYNVLL